MVFQRHNAQHNYFNATGGRDTEFAKDLVLNDIANIVSESKQMVVAAIKHAKIAIEEKPSNRKIVDVIIDNKDNEQLNKNIARLITTRHNADKSNNASGMSNYSNAAGNIRAIGALNRSNRSGHGNIQQYHNAGGIMSSISGVLSTLGVGNKEQLNTLVEAKTGKKETSTGTKIAWGIGIVSAIGIIVYLMKKS